MYWQFVLDRRFLNILKARQLGFTTYFQIYGLDKALNESNANIKFVSQTDDVAKSAFSEKAMLAYQELSPMYVKWCEEQHGTPLAKSNQSQIEFNHGWGLYTYVSLRGGTASMVHISELGPMAAENMKRAEEVFAGAMETASNDADVVIESTFKGGQYGIYYENLKKSYDRGEESRPKGQFWFMFFPWYEDKTYRIDDPTQEIKPATEKYFNELEAKVGFKFDHGQKLWWQTKEDRLGSLMFQENPSTPEEAMTAPVEGAIYADILVQLQKDGRQCDLAYNRSYPIYAGWDIGKRDPTSIWLVQLIDGWIHWIHHFHGSGEEPEYYADLIRDTELPIHTHLLPHDAYQERAGGSWHGILKKYGVKNMKRLDKTNDRWIGIRALQGMLKRSKFDIKNTEYGFDCLMNYRSEIDIKNGIMKAIPVHDWASDSADAARSIAEGIITKKIKELSYEQIERKNKAVMWRRQESVLNNGFRNSKWWQ